MEDSADLKGEARTAFVKRCTEPETLEAPRAAIEPQPRDRDGTLPHSNSTLRQSAKRHFLRSRRGAPTHGLRVRFERPGVLSTSAVAALIPDQVAAKGRH